VAGARRENAHFDASLRTIEARDDERSLRHREFVTINRDGIYQVSLPSDAGVT
jgi:cytidylate kinase